MDQETTTTLNQNVDMLFSNLENFTQKEGVIGKPVVQDNKTFLPVVSVTLGYGGGNSANKTQPEDSSNSSNQTLGGIASKMAGGALGFGAKLNTEAIIVIDKDKDSVSMLPLTSGANLTEKIPQMLMNMGQGKMGQMGGTQGQSGGTGGTGSSSYGSSGSGGTGGYGNQ